MNKLVILCAALLVAVCHLGKAYDFQDADFNELLSSDFEEIVHSLNDIPLHPRARRDEESVSASDEKCKRKQGGHRGRSRLCCADQTIDALHDKEKELSRACYKEVTGNEKSDKHDHGHHRKFDLFSCEEVEKRKSDMTCIHQCVGQKKGILADDGSPNAEKLINYLKESFASEAWFGAVADKVVATCLAEAKNATETPTKYYTENLKMCNPTGITLKHCLFKEIQLSCPADQIKDKSACDRFQDRLKRGEGRELEGSPSPVVDGQVKDE